MVKLFTTKPTYMKGWESAEVLHKGGMSKDELESYLLYEQISGCNEFIDWDKGFSGYIDSLEEV